MFAASLAMLCLLAQDLPRTPRPVEAKSKAQVLLKQGARHYQRAEFAEALEHFQRAYGIFASPKLLLNIGQASREVGRPVEAMVAFEKFLEQASDAPDRAIAEAQQSIAELSQQVGRLRIDAVAGAEITVDGKPVGVSPVENPIPVMPGTHEVRAVLASGSGPISKRLAIAAGAVETVVLRPVPVLTRAPGPRRDLAAEQTTGARAQKSRSEGGWLLGRTWTWVAVGAAVALAGGAATAGLVMQSKYQALDQSCGRSAGANYRGCSSGDVGTVDTWKTTANVLWGLSAAAAITAGALFYVEGRAVAVSPTAGPVVGLQASMRY